MAGARGGLAIEGPAGQEDGQRPKGQIRVPTFGGAAGGTTLRQYKRKVKIWCVATEVPKWKQGVTLLSRAHG